MSDIANNIKNLRKGKGLSQEQMAEKGPRHPPDCIRLGAGIAQPGLDTLEEIARALEAEPEQLLYGRQSGPQKPAYRAVSFWPMLGVVPLYLLMTLFIFPIFMGAWLGSHDVVFTLCGQMFLAMLIMGCYCALKDLIRNREYYDKLEDEEEKP